MNSRVGGGKNSWFRDFDRTTSRRGYDSPATSTADPAEDPATLQLLSSDLGPTATSRLSAVPTSSTGQHKGVPRISPTTLYRDLQTVRAYSGASSGKRTSAYTSSRPNTGYRSTFQQVSDHSDESDHEDEEIMELKRHLGSAKQELQFAKDRISQLNAMLSKRDKQIIELTTDLTKLTRSISTSGHASGFESSTYSNRVSSGTGSLNGLSGKPSLNKEIMQKLRSMTETIKMLSEENKMLREQQKPDSVTNVSSPDPKRMEDYEDLSKSELISLVVSYDQKVKALSSEISTLTKNREESQNKDKYKQLARRLKEERNQYKDAIQEKTQEQESLKAEMENMSELICELRDQCQQLQNELEQQKPGPALVTKSVQVNTLSSSPSKRTSSNPSVRKPSISSVNDSSKKAKSVYLNQKPVANGPTTKQTPKPAANRSSPMKKNMQSNLQKQNQQKTGGARIAKPVNRPPAKSSVSPSPSKSSASSAAQSPRKVSRLPQPSPSRLPRPKNTNNNANTNASKGSSINATPSPSAPPPSQRTNHEELSRTPTPPLSPVEPSLQPQSVHEDSNLDEKSILEEEELIVIQEDGRIQINSLSDSKPRADSTSSDVPSTPEADDDHGPSPSAPSDATPRSRRKHENGIAQRRIQRTWKHFYEELEEHRGQNPELPLSKLAEVKLLGSSSSNSKDDETQHSTDHNTSNHKSTVAIDATDASMSNSSPQLNASRKLSLPTKFTSSLERSQQGDGQDEALEGIQAAFSGHHARSKSLSMLRNADTSNRIHIARPWMKKKEQQQPQPPPSLTEESSEEDELMHVEAAMLAHERRRAALKKLAMQRLEMDRFGVDGVRSLNSNNSHNRAAERSDGVTEEDDDDDVVY